jgi:hypothetical protein
MINMVEIMTVLVSLGGILTIAWGYVKLMGRTAARNITEEEAKAIGEELYKAAKDGQLTQDEAIAIISKVLTAVATE